MTIQAYAIEARVWVGVDHLSRYKYPLSLSTEEALRYYSRRRAHEFALIVSAIFDIYSLISNQCSLCSSLFRAINDILCC
jgi:hypothetical protein